MRACEGCRRRKIKCDAATTNTWPCSACIRLKLHCVRPNGFDGATDTQVYEPTQQQYDAMAAQDGFRQQAPLQEQQLMASMSKQPSSSLYPPPQGYANPPAALYQSYPESSNMQQNLHYTDLQPPVNVVDQPYAPQTSFPTPPLQQSSRPGSSPESYQQDPYSQHDLADLLGSLKVNEAGTGKPSQSVHARRTLSDKSTSTVSE